MGSILIEDFKTGLDRRKMNETSLPGSLVVLENAHITRGGEIEKAEAYVRFCNLPLNTYGLKAVRNGFMVFGSDNISPTLLNSNPPVRYQRLNDGSANMIDILSVDLYDGKPYVIADYDDGIIRHFYNGTKVAAMFSGKGRAKFAISNNGMAAAVSSNGSFFIVGATAGCSITSILVGAVELLAEPVIFDDTDDLYNFPRLVINGINANSNASGFTAEVQAGQKVLITSAIPGATNNGDTVNVTAVAGTGAISIQNVEDMANGADASKITDITVNAVSIFDAGVDVDWAESDAETAIAVAAAINDFSGTSGYEAFSYGASVLIRKVADGAGANGQAVVITTSSAAVTATPAATTIQGGSASPTIIEPGRFAKTMKRKVYVLSGSSMYYSAVDAPSDFAGTGSGFDNLSNNTSGAENLVALANYFDNLAIISRTTAQIWFVTDDPDQNQQLQVLNNTGTIAPRSVVEYGNNDVFYLNNSGIRSLRARDQTNAAFVNDVGIAIDDLIQEKILSDSVAAEAAIGIVEPRQGRLQMQIGDTVFVFSFFPSSKISAWSTYKPGFLIEDMDYLGQTVAVRSRNAIYKIGSTTKRVYDSRLTKMITPFLSGSDPSLVKDFCGLDLACQGTWEIYVALDPLLVDEDGFPLEDAFEHISTVTGTTYADQGGENGNVEFDLSSTHIALMLINRDPQYARVGNIELHFNGGEKAE